MLCLHEGTLKWDAFKGNVKFGISGTEGRRTHRKHNFNRGPTFKRIAGGLLNFEDGRPLRRALRSVQGWSVMSAEFFIGFISGFSGVCAWTLVRRNIGCNWFPWTLRGMRPGGCGVLTVGRGRRRQCWTAGCSPIEMGSVTVAGNTKHDATRIRAGIKVAKKCMQRPLTRRK